MLTAILIDDQENSLGSLTKKLLNHCPEVSIVAACTHAEKAIELIDSLRPDLVFLDIEMPVMNGFVMLQQLSYKNFELIFTTAYDHYAIRAIRFSALDYLVKPIDVEELSSAVQRAAAKRSLTKSSQQLELLLENLVPKKSGFRRIAIPSVEGLQFVKVEDIIYLEANTNYTHIFLENRKYIVSHTLKDFEEMLPADTFLRIHNSWLINKNYVEKYIRGEGGQVVMTNGVALDVSKRKKPEFLKAIGY
jgi:two-component system LytT family response regulator